ncbi:WD40 repeat-like protein [Gloeophyllum trabeum ATCC 11539]|uniref:DNA damage-binding protein CMR1 n=1 Tax=Gloeophyllum trabeum (strain ATCC 11539 / FP-39264 / Madison 617) TaxID=670483 RepID=S7QFV0_GLOTA|nr:WD40 repeat-like protein [Gloeophyllum trabeum ATCC 11539]EPQ58018.1 WD40 repeat-like protein [Gloeophyllum trabeum ATCC 11539]
MPKTAYELEREANIAKNRAILEELDLKGAVAQLGLPSKGAQAKRAAAAAKPVQPAKKRKREEKDEAPAPRRQSTRLRRAGAADPNETPAERKIREKLEEERRMKEEEERLEAEEKAREARKPRHQDLDLETLMEGEQPEDVAALKSTLAEVCKTSHAKRTAEQDAFVFDDDEKEEVGLAALRKRMQKLKVVARAKVTQDRVYSAVYHPEVSKDIILFGDKHGQLGLWDARAAPDEVAGEDEEVSATANGEDGKYWRMQAHWPVTSKSSISTVKLDPIDSNNVFTSAYDCTIRKLDLTTGVSREIHSTEDVLISSIDLPPAGHEMWISDALGGISHLDLREHPSKARWYGLSDQKIGCVSINPVNPQYLLTASNSRALRLWDARKLQTFSGVAEGALLTPPPSSPVPASRIRGATTDDRAGPEEHGAEEVEQFLKSKRGKGCLRAEWVHGKSVSSAYWDPRGRSIVSTSYDDTLRLWDIRPAAFDKGTTLPSFRPFSQIRHNCQTGKWLTILKAQWTPNPDVYPHFTIGNMDHSLDIFSCKGDVVAKLSDRQRISAVQAVTCSHPSIVERAASGNASGRCVLWALPDDSS